MVKVALFGILLAGVLVFLASCNSATISGAQARSLVQDGARLVDVRTPAEYTDGHIEGAINIPVQQLADRISELPDKSTPVVLYCRSGRRSGQAKQILEEAGFQTVHNMGGMSRWDHDS